MVLSWLGANPFARKHGPGMFGNVELGRLQKAVTKQLEFEIKEAGTENCKMQLECSHFAA